MTIEIKWNDGVANKVSTISNDMILSTRIVSGKNQPFGAVEAVFDRYIFSTEYRDVNWQNDEGEEGYNPTPEITHGESKMSVDTYGSVVDYVITSVATDEDYTIVTAHHPAYTLTHTYFSSLFLNILTVEDVEDTYAIFRINLPGTYETSNILNDYYRASVGAGCTYEHKDTFGKMYGYPPGPTIEPPTSDFGSTLFDLSRYTSGKGYYGGKEGYDEVTKKKYTIWYSYRSINLIFHVSVETIEDKHIRSIEWIEGKGEDIIRFMVLRGVSDNVYPQTFSPPMTYYPNFEEDTGLLNSEPKKEYTENELNKALSKGMTGLNQKTYDYYDYGTPIGTGLSTSRLRLRINGTSTCKTILDAIASLTNRKYHFSSEGLFVTNIIHNSVAKQYYLEDGDFKSKDVIINEREVVYLDVDTSSKYNDEVEAEITSGAPNIQDNTDAVVITSQTVYGENYSWKTSNISSPNSREGGKILFPIVDMSDDGGEGMNSYRNRMLGLCAYNELVNKFKYENSILYTTSEIDAVPEASGDVLIDDYDTFLRETGQIYNGDDEDTFPSEEYSIGTTILFNDGIVMEKVIKEWEEVDGWEEADIYEVTSSYKYSADSYTKTLIDNFNGFEITDVPLAFLIRLYPEHTTVLAWGKSHTNDLPEQIREQQEDIMISGAPGDEDMEISDKYSSRLVVGNLTQSQLAEQDDVKNGFTGLIMEKNVSAELYRLAGYNKGVVQAEFDTEGKIVAGEGKTTLDEEGLTVLFNGDYSGEYHEPQSALKFRCIQNPNWESATLFSSMLKVNIPSQGTVNRENLTALTLNDGPAPDKIPSNLLLATSGSSYGSSTTQTIIDTDEKPHIIQLANKDFHDAVYFGEEEALDSPGCYLGYNSDILSSSEIDTQGLVLPSGLKLKFTIEIKAQSGGYGGPVRLNYAYFKFGGGYIPLNLGGVEISTPGYNEIKYVNYTDVKIEGVIPCVGPIDVDLDYDAISALGQTSTARISSWSIGVYGCITAERLYRDVDTNMGALYVTTGRWGGNAGTLITGRDVEISHTSSNPVSIQLITGQTAYDRFVVGAGVTEIKQVTYNGAHNARCKIDYHYNKNTPQNNTTLNIALHPTGTGKLTFKTTSTSSRGSMLFLRNDGAYLFGNLNIAGGEKANMSFQPSGIAVADSIIGFNEAVFTGIANFNNMEIKGRYTSDGLPEASGLGKIGDMMRITRISPVSSGSLYPNNTGYPIYVMLVHQHQFLRVSLIDKNSNETQIYESGDNKNGDGQSTASFYVPPGWSWKCSGGNTKYATVFHFVGSGM